MRTSRTKAASTRTLGIPGQTDTTERRFLPVVALGFLVLLFVVALTISQPTLFQVHVFKTLLALSAAGIGALIPGFIEVDYKPYIRAGGALALFVIVYVFDPSGYTADDVTVYVSDSLLPQERSVSEPTKDMISTLKKQSTLHPDTIEELSRCRARPEKCTLVGFSDATLPPISLPIVDVSSSPVDIQDIQTFGNSSPIVVDSENVTIKINQR